METTPFNSRANNACACVLHVRAYILLDFILQIKMSFTVWCVSYVAFCMYEVVIITHTLSLSLSLSLSQTSGSSFTQLPLIQANV